MPAADEHYRLEAVSEAILRRDEIIPALLDILESVIRDPEPYIENYRRFDHIYAMYLLAQFRETRAYPLLLNIFSTPANSHLSWSTTWSDGLGKILASVSGGDISGMTELGENDAANDLRGSWSDWTSNVVRVRHSQPRRTCRDFEPVPR